MKYYFEILDAETFHQGRIYFFRQTKVRTKRFFIVKNKKQMNRMQFKNTTNDNEQIML